jgi:hypothetical protein
MKGKLFLAELLDELEDLGGVPLGCHVVEGMTDHAMLVDNER